MNGPETVKTENVKKKGGKTKGFIATGAVLLVLVLTGLLLRNDLLFFAGERLVQGRNFTAAENVLEYGSNEKCRALCEYAALRNSINEKYPLLLENYDSDTVMQWRSTVERLNSEGLLKGASVESDIHSLAVRLKYICDADASFERTEKLLHELMDVFLEYNRLHIHTNGINTRFTVNEELAKLEAWQAKLEEITDYAQSLPDYEQIYLFSYVIKEARGEIEELYAAMQSILDAGYGPDDEIRYSDNSRKSFPVTENQSGVSVSLTNKSAYTEQMRIELREYLVQSQLITYYIIE